MHDNKHFLIVGAGLAGVCVATHLIQSGVQVTMVDNGKNHSSLVAAGMINPLVFRRMTKSWRVDDFMPYLRTFYSSLEALTSTSFFHSVPVRRLHSSKQEQGYWLKKQETEDFTPYMEKVTEQDLNYDKAINEFGSARLKQTFYVDVHAFFRSMKNWLAQHCALLEVQFDYSRLQGTTYAGETYTDVIFCEGYLGKENPWFGDLPLGQTKGQTLLIASQTLPEGVSLNKKCFMLPQGNRQFKIGATHEWHNPTTHITPEGRAELLEKLSCITSEHVRVLEQKAGVRPTSVDRRPFLGTHPKHTSYHIFNGLGTKGYMTAPLLSKEFCDYLLKGVALNPEVTIRRFMH